MSALIRNLRSIWDRFESETGKVGSTGGANTRDVFTTDPDPIEATASIGTPIPADLDTMLHQGGPADMSDTLIYGWFLTSPPLDSAFSQSTTTRGPGFGIIVSDDTNITAYGLGGSNRAGFRHNAERPDWQAIVLDTYVARSRSTTFPRVAVPELSLLTANAANVTSNQHNATNNAEPNFTAITEAGYFVTRLAAAKGGTENTFCDIMRYGTEGIQVIGDSAGATSTLLDIAVADRSGAANAAHAAVRETGQKSYSINSKITIGDSAGGSQSVNFVETNSVVGFETYPLKKRFEYNVTLGRSAFDSAGVPRFRIVTSAPTTGGTTGFKLGTRTGDGTGGSGCVLTIPTLVDVDFNLSNINVDSVGIYGSTFRNLESLKFRTDRNNVHQAYQNDFIGCGPIFSNIDYKNNSHFNTAQRLNTRGYRFPEQQALSRPLPYTSSILLSRQVGYMKPLEWWAADITVDSAVIGNRGLNRLGQIEILDQSLNLLLDSATVVANGLGSVINVGNNHNITRLYVRFANETLGQTSAFDGEFRYKTGPITNNFNFFEFYFHGDSGEYASQLTTSQSTLTGLYFDRGTIGPSGHAINIDSATPNQEFTLQDCTFLNYASTTGNTGREAIINSSGQPIRVLVSGTTNAPSVDSDGIRGRVTIVNNVTTTISGVLGNSEIKVLPTSGSPYSGNTLNDTLSIATETVSADTFVGDGTNYYRYDTYLAFGAIFRVELTAVGTASFSGVLTDGDAASTALADGDKVRVTIRDDADNPTLQLFDEFTVAGTPTSSTINFTIANADFTSAFGTALNGANSKTVTVEKVDARFQFSVASGTEIDFLTYRVGSDTILTTGQTITNDNSSFPLSQVGDRNYKDPA